MTLGLANRHLIGQDRLEGQTTDHTPWNGPELHGLDEHNSIDSTTMVWSQWGSLLEQFQHESIKEAF